MNTSKLRLRLFTAGILATMLFTASANAASDYLLQLEGIEGEARDPNHKGWVELRGYDTGILIGMNQATGGGGGAGKVSFQDLHFSKTMDKSTPKLMLACCKGTHIPKVTLELRDASSENSQPYYKVELSDCMVSSYSATGATGDRPTESFSLNFTKITWTYYFQDEAGKTQQITGSYELSPRLR